MLAVAKQHVTKRKELVKPLIRDIIDDTVKALT
jgi:hypothetical protein